MQAILLISIFSLVITIAASMISSGTSNTELLTKQRIEETTNYFQEVANVMRNDITLNYMHGNPKGAANPSDYINGLSQLRSLSDGRLARQDVDAWGMPIKGVIVTEYQPLTSSSDPDNNVSVPVTGMVFVSGGPDAIIQTNIPAVTKLSALYGISVPTDANGNPTNDDIIYSFDNREIQQQAWTNLKSHMNRIGTAALRELQMRTSVYRQSKLAQYQANIAAGKDVNLSYLDISNDTNAPKFLDLTNLDNRRVLGVDEDFSIIERPIPAGSSNKMVLTTPAVTLPTDSLIIKVNNSSSAPTPWGPGSNFKFQVKISPNAT